ILVLFPPGNRIDDLSTLKDDHVVSAARSQAAVLVEEVGIITGRPAGDRLAPGGANFGFAHARADGHHLLRLRRWCYPERDSHHDLPPTGCQAAIELKKPLPSGEPCN